MYKYFFLLGAVLTITQIFFQTSTLLYVEGAGEVSLVSAETKSPGCVEETKGEVRPLLS